MRIFLCLRHAQVAQFEPAHYVRQNVRHCFRWNHHRQVEVLVVPRHANILQVLRHALARDCRIQIRSARQIASALCVQPAVAAQRTRDLAHTIGAKVETDARIVVADLSQRLAARIRANERQNELVGHAFVVGIFHAQHSVRVRSALGFALDHRAVGLGDSLPAAVAVHGVITAVDGRDLARVVLAHLLLQLFEIASAIGGQRVAAVHKGVYEDAIDSLLPGHLQERVQMLLPRMHAAVG